MKLRYELGRCLMPDVFCFWNMKQSEAINIGYKKRFRSAWMPSANNRYETHLRFKTVAQLR